MSEQPDLVDPFADAAAADVAADVAADGELKASTSAGSTDKVDRPAGGESMTAAGPEPAASGPGPALTDSGSAAKSGPAVGSGSVIGPGSPVVSGPAAVGFGAADERVPEPDEEAAATPQSQAGRAWTGRAVGPLSRLLPGGSVDPLVGAAPAQPADPFPAASPDEPAVGTEPRADPDAVNLNEPVVAPQSDKPAMVAVPRGDSDVTELEESAGVAASTSVEDPWRGVLVGFVDDPRGSVEAASALIDDDIARHIALLARHKDSMHAAWRGNLDADTEALRISLVNYRDLRNRLTEVAAVLTR